VRVNKAGIARVALYDLYNSFGVERMWECDEGWWRSDREGVGR
jgi:hypothetical protein